MAISRIAPSGGDYVSLTAWQAAKARNLTGQGPEIAELESFADTESFTLQGWVTTPSDYIEIRTPLTHRHNGTAGTGYRLTANLNSAALTIAEAYVRVVGLEISNQSTGLVSRCISFGSLPAQNDIRIEACLLHDCGGYAVNNSQSNLNITVMNTAVYNAGGRGIWLGPAAQQRVLFCSLYQCQEDGIKAATEAFGSIAVDTGIATGFDFHSTTSMGDFNISGDQSANSPSSLTGQSATALYRSITPGSIDLRLKSGGTPADNLVAAFPLDPDGVALDRDFRGRSRVLPTSAGWWAPDATAGLTHTLGRGLSRGLARGI